MLTNGPAIHKPVMNGQYFIPPKPGPGYPAPGYIPPPAYQPQPYPPPYTGAPPYNPYQGMAPPPQPGGGGKAAEAYASGQNVYVPAPQGNFAPSAPPPPYEDSSKKDQ